MTVTYGYGIAPRVSRSGNDRFRVTTWPSRGIGLAVEAGCVVGVNILEAITGIVRAIQQYSSAIHPCYENETSTFMTDWEVTEVASCL